MKIERVKNTRRNILWGTVNKIVTLLLPFIMRTLLIYELGMEYLGLWSLFGSILQVLNLAELGISSAIVFNMYKPIAENDTNTICSLLAFYKKIYRYIGLFILIAGLGLMPFLKYLIKGAYPSDVNIYVLYVLYLLNTVISYLLFAYKSCLLTAFQRNDIISNINTFIFIVQYILQIVILLVFKSFYLYYIIIPVCTIVNNLLIEYITRKNYPEYVGRGKINVKIKENMKKNIGGVMLGKICVTSRNSLDNIVISSFVGLTTVAAYGNYYYIFSSILGFLQVACAAIGAGIGNSVATETPEKNYFDLKKINFLYAWLAGWCTICLLNLYQPFMKLWVGEKQMLSMVEVVLFCAYFYALTMGDIRSKYSAAAGLWWEGRFYVATEAIGNLVLNLVLVHIWGIAGVIIATLITIVSCNFIWGSQIVFKYYFKNISAKEFYKSHVFYAVTAVIGGVVTWLINNRICVENGYIELIITGMVCVVIPNIFFWIVYRKTNIYKEAVVLLKRLMK